jgi:hypothetical protein
MIEPVCKQSFQMQFAAHTAYSPFLRQHGMPRENLHPIQPAILHYQEPSGVTLGLNATHRTRQSTRSLDIHGPFLFNANSLLGRRCRPARFHGAAERHRHHSQFGVESQGEMVRTCLTQPEMFPSRESLPLPIERVQIMGRSFRKEKLTFHH